MFPKMILQKCNYGLKTNFFANGTSIVRSNRDHIFRNMNDNINFFKNLILVAASDGYINNRELLHLYKKSQELDISDEDFDQWLLEPDKLEQIMPPSREEKERLLIDMISMAIADSYFGAEEFELCNQLARELDYSGLTSVLEHNVNLSHIINLILVASADGNITADERLILENTISRLGYNVGDLEHLIAMSKKMSYFIPEDEEEIEKQLIQLLTMAMSDGEMTPSEYILCNKIAEKMGLTKRELDMILKLSYNIEVTSNGEESVINSHTSEMS